MTRLQMASTVTRYARDPAWPWALAAAVWLLGATVFLR